MNLKINYRNGVLAGVLLLLLSFRLFCGHAPDLKEYQETRLLLGTTVTLHCFYDKRIDIQPVIQQTWKRVETIQALMSALSEQGDIALINSSGTRAVNVNPSVYAIIKEAIHFSRVTKGTFDITVFPLIELWKNAERIGQIPDVPSISKAKEKVGYQFIKPVKPSTIRLNKMGMKIDLGAIAKGYAVDEIARILAQNKIKNFMIDAGGDILCRGKNNGKRDWKIGVQDPRNKALILDVLKLNSAAVTTSGNYERFYTIEGNKYSHIIDPHSGYPQKSVLSATVIAPSTEEADAYSTALSVMGGKKGINLVNTLRDVEAMVIEEINGRVKTFRSKGYKTYLFKATFKD